MAVTQRMQELGIKHVFQGCAEKISYYERIARTLNVPAEQIAYMGDDVLDIPLMQRVGLAITVPNAIDAVKSIAHHCTLRKGGQGAVREVCDLLLMPTLSS